MEENMKINFETITMSEKRVLIEYTNKLVHALTKEEFTAIMIIYNNVLDRLLKEAEKQGIDV